MHELACHKGLEVHIDGEWSLRRSNEDLILPEKEVVVLAEKVLLRKVMSELDLKGSGRFFPAEEGKKGQSRQKEQRVEMLKGRKAYGIFGGQKEHSMAEESQWWAGQEIRLDAVAGPHLGSSAGWTRARLYRQQH